MMNIPLKGISSTIECLRRAGRECVCVMAYAAEADPECLSNEFLLIIKPESLSGRSTFRVLQRVFQILEEKEVKCAGLQIFNREHAVATDFFENQYCTLNRAAQKGVLGMNGCDVSRIEEGGFEHVIGAYQLLEMMPELTAHQLEQVAHAGQTIKISNGNYLTPFVCVNGNYNVLNAFHPYQIELFNAPDNVTAALVCRTVHDYEYIADFVTGHFNPAQATVGSLRRSLYDEQCSLTLEVIDTVRNGFHNSPSPLEAMFAIKRVFSLMHYSETTLGRRLISMNVPESFLAGLQLNPEITTIDQGVVSTFEYFEGRNTNDIVHRITEIYERSYRQ